MLHSSVVLRFFRHYAAYKVVFTREQDVEAIVRVAVVDEPMVPPPLAEAKVLDGDGDGDDGAAVGAADGADDDGDDADDA